MAVDFRSSTAADTRAINAALRDSWSETIRAAGIQHTRTSVTFREDPRLGPDVDEATVKGGHLIYQGSNPANYCTSGFTARNDSNGWLGIITAQHCGSAQTSYGSAGAILDHVKYAANQPGGQKVDLSFYRTLSPHLTVDEFQYDNGAHKTVNQLGFAAIDLLVCEYGMTSGKTCDVIKDNYQCRTVPSGTWCGLAVTNNHYQTGGDSGGPWFYGNQAVGIHKGSNSTGEFGLFTMIHKAADNLFVTVLTE